MVVIWIDGWTAAFKVGRYLDPVVACPEAPQLRVMAIRSHRCATHQFTQNGGTLGRKHDRLPSRPGCHVVGRALTRSDDGYRGPARKGETAYARSYPEQPPFPRINAAHPASWTCQGNNAPVTSDNPPVSSTRLTASGYN